MPMVVPGINNQATNPTEEWTHKLVGKTISDQNHSEVNFCKRDLPEKHRIIEPGMMVTKDFVPERLNVHVDNEGKVTHCQHG